MKQEFSTQWNASVQPRKQRKYLFNAPLHTKHKFLSAHLSKELKVKYGKRNLPLRKGDEVLIMRGAFKKKKAKVTSVNLKDSLVSLENVQRTKKDGSKVNVMFPASVLMIVSLSLDDKRRQDTINKKAQSATPKPEKKAEVKQSNKEKKNASK
jgi:large subunit ribosomal protein L24